MGLLRLEWLFNRGPYATAGGDGIVNATGWNPPDGYGVDWAPSMRMVVDLTDLDASQWVQLTGQSGHVFSPHYTDQTEAWARGETYRMALLGGRCRGRSDRHVGAGEQLVPRRLRLTGKMPSTRWSWGSSGSGSVSRSSSKTIANTEVVGPTC